MIWQNILKRQCYSDQHDLCKTDDNGPCKTSSTPSQKSNTGVDSQTQTWRFQMWPRDEEALCLVIVRLTGGAGRAGHPVLGEVDVAHVGAAAAESVGAILDLWWRGSNHATVVMAVLLVANVSPTACKEGMQMAEWIRYKVCKNVWGWKPFVCMHFKVCNLWKSHHIVWYRIL